MEIMVTVNLTYKIMEALGNGAVDIIVFREFPLRWRHNGRDSVWNHQPHDCLLNRLFRRRS